MCSFCCTEDVIEDNPYPGYFNNKQLERLVDFIKMGQTWDAEILGLASKFELEALTEYLLTSWGHVMLQVRMNVQLR